MSKNLVLGGLAALAALLLFVLIMAGLRPPAQPPATSVGSVTQADWEAASLTSNGTLDVSGETTVHGFTQGGGYLATSTDGTSETLLEATLLADNYIEMTPNTGTFTWTLPATSTLTTLIPGEGDMREWLIHNATTSSGITMTLAAGTGIDLIAVTASDDVIDENEFARLSCWRQDDTDVTCLVSELLHAD